MKPSISSRGCPVYLASPIDNEDDLDALYMWVDEFTLSRPKKNIARDFSDGVLAAEIVHTYFPKLVELHNYHAASAVDKKVYNWNTLNRLFLFSPSTSRFIEKVFKKIGFQMHPSDIKDVCNAKAFAIEKVLNLFKGLLPELKANAENSSRHLDSAATSNVGHMPRPPRSAATSNPGSAMAFPPATPNLPVGDSLSGVSSFLPHNPSNRGLASYEQELLDEKDRTIEDLKDAILRLQEKNARLEQLVKIKDSRIDALMQRLAANDIHVNR